MEHTSISLSSRGRTSAVKALIRRDYLIKRSYRASIVLDFLYGFLNLLVYFFISRVFGGVDPGTLGGAPTYFAFAAVGIAISAVLDAASTALARRVREEQLTGTLEALLAQPVRSADIAIGFAGFPFVFAIGRAAVYLVMAGILLGVDLSQASWPAFVVMLLLTSAAMGSIGILAGALVLVIKRGDTLASTAIFAMGMLGGALFPISVLPGWLQPLAHIVPTRFAFHGLRTAIFLGHGWGRDALALLLFDIVSLPVAVWVFGRALELGKGKGSLTYY